MRVVIVTGLSGAGKSQAVDCMEDMGYYCIDNMPPALIKDFINLSVQDRIKVDRAAFVVDIRGGEFFDDFKTSLCDLKKSGSKFKILFLEASDEVLIRRFKETRRTHPLSGPSNIIEGIRKEREKLSEIRALADYIIDTSTMRASNLKAEISSLLLSGKDTDVITMTISSFGYKNGMPLDADMVFDVRFLPNPFYLAGMKQLTGNNKKVQAYVLKFPEAGQFLKMVQDMVEYLIPLYAKEGKSHLSIAFGCTGGQHRSVVLVNAIASALASKGIRVIKTHRDL
jgi:UPF0042 nucleotide-binding protein